MEHPNQVAAVAYRVVQMTPTGEWERLRADLETCQDWLAMQADDSVSRFVIRAVDPRDETD